MSVARRETEWDRPAQVGFWAHVVTQFQGAFNDNLFKFLIILFLARDIPQGEPERVNTITFVASSLFAVPFLMFPVIAGRLADRHGKKRIALATKYAELGIMCVGMAAFWLGRPWLLWVALFMMTTQSTFYSPAKYGILPEMLPSNRLSWGNGIISMTTFLAIILGTAVSGPLRDWLGEQMYLTALPLVLLSATGIATAHFIANPTPADAEARLPWNPWSGLWRYFKVFLADRWLSLTMLGIAFFFFAGALVQVNIVRLGKIELGLEDRDTPLSLLTAALALGIAVGSLVAGLASRRRIEPGLVPLGALGLAVSALLLSLPVESYGANLALLLCLGFAGGFYIVPLNAVLQQRSPTQMKGGMIAAGNFITFGGVLLAGLLFWVFGQAGLSSRHVFAIIGVMTLGVGVFICWVVPVFLIRLVLWVLGNTVYRIKVLHGDRLPDVGGALLVANHTSFVDALLLTAATSRPIRFLMYAGYYRNRWIAPLAKMMKAIPVASTEGPKALVASLRSATEALNRDEVVCVFPEGQVTRTGQMQPFHKGFERIMKGAPDKPVIPVHIDRVWGSVFSFSGGRFFWKTPARLPYPITVNVGEPLAADTSTERVRRALRDLETEAHNERKPDRPLLHRVFIKNARRTPGKLCVADKRSGALSYFKTLAGSIVLARKLKPIVGSAAMTGVMLPPSVGGALTNIALQMMGSVPINLNYTLSNDGLKSCAEQCELQRVVTAKALLEKVSVDAPCEPVYLEDVMKSVTKADRLAGALLALLCPARLLERLVGSPGGRTQDDVATIIFSSGSEGKPKGVILTQNNILSNVEASLQVFPHERGDGIMGILPFFHSFGFTVTIWLPFYDAMFAVYHPTPLEPRAIGDLVKEYRPSLFLATSTLLQGFIRRCTADQLESLSFVVCGAEKLAERVRDAFASKFGVEPLEGYGTTECAPVVSVNIPDFEAPGFYQKGFKRGTIGRPIPGVSVCARDLDTDKELPVNETGMLHVKGPNIMRGYLDMPERTAEVLRDGWYETGDLGFVDEEGFVTITGRLSRFSKIGGEMVPHVRIEEALHDLLGLTDLSLAVTGVPDTQKGERLVVLHTLDEEQLDTLFEKLESSDLPALWRPRRNAFYQVEEIPVLGTGKMDIKRVKQLAEDMYVGEGDDEG